MFGRAHSLHLNCLRSDHSLVKAALPSFSFNCTWRWCHWENRSWEREKWVPAYTVWKDPKDPSSWHVCMATAPSARENPPVLISSCWGVSGMWLVGMWVSILIFLIRISWCMWQRMMDDGCTWAKGFCTHVSSLLLSLRDNMDITIIYFLLLI